MTEVDKKLKLFESVNKAACFGSDKLLNLSQIIDRRKAIAQDYSEKHEEEYKYLNALLREHLGL